MEKSSSNVPWDTFICDKLQSQSMKHWRSCQEGYQLVAVRTYGNFIVLPHREIRLPWPMTSYPTQLYYPDTELNQSLSYPNNTEHPVTKWWVSIFSVIGLTRPGFEPPRSSVVSAVIKITRSVTTIEPEPRLCSVWDMRRGVDSVHVCLCMRR